ncbi:hypothetical protein D3C76_1155570 [compost metagenome]
MFQYRFGEPGQVIADFHQRQAAGDFRSGDPQAVRQLEMAQGLHLLLEVVLGNPGQAFAQLSGQLRCQRRLEQPAFVEQLIEQQRKAGDLFGDPWARCTQGQQAAQGTGIFGQQNEISRTAGYSFHQWQHPFQHQIRIGMLDSLGQQARNKGVEALTPQSLHGAQLRAAA